MIGEARLRALSVSATAVRLDLEVVPEGPTEGDGSDIWADEGIADIGAWRKGSNGFGDGVRAGEVSGERKCGVPWVCGKGEGCEAEPDKLGVVTGESKERYRSELLPKADVTMPGS